MVWCSFYYSDSSYQREKETFLSIVFKYNLWYSGFGLRYHFEGVSMKKNGERKENLKIILAISIALLALILLSIAWPK